MTEIRPVSTDDDYKIACYFHDKLTELYSHWKIKFHLMIIVTVIMLITMITL